MVNTEDDEEPYEDEYRPDGKYIPRLVFLDKNGDLLEQFINKRGEQKNYKYYYSTPADIVASMKSVLKYYGVKVPELEKAKSIKPKKVSKKVDEKDDKKVEENMKEEKKADDKKDENKKEDKSSSKNDKKTEL